MVSTIKEKSELHFLHILYLQTYFLSHITGIPYWFE